MRSKYEIEEMLEAVIEGLKIERAKLEEDYEDYNPYRISALRTRRAMLEWVLGLREWNLLRN